MPSSQEIIAVRNALIREEFGDNSGFEQEARGFNLPEFFQNLGASQGIGNPRNERIVETNQIPQADRDAVNKGAGLNRLKDAVLSAKSTDGFASILMQDELFAEDAPNEQANVGGVRIDTVTGKPVFDSRPGFVQTNPNEDIRSRVALENAAKAQAGVGAPAAPGVAQVPGQATGEPSSPFSPPTPLVSAREDPLKGGSTIGKSEVDKRAGLVTQEQHDAVARKAGHIGPSIAEAVAGVDALTRPTETAIEGKRIQIGDKRDRLESIRRGFTNPDFLTWQGKFQGAVTAGKSKLGIGLSPEETSFREGQRRLGNRVITNLSLLLNELSGAAVSEKEFERISNTMPNMDQAPVDFNTDLKEVILQHDFAMARYNLWDISRMEGKTQGKPWDISSADVVDAMDSAIEVEYNKLIEVGITEEEALDAAIQLTERGFGVTAGGYAEIDREFSRRK